MSNEPVLITAAVIAVAQVVIGVLTNHIDVTLITAAVTAVGAIFQRSQVTPNKKVRARHSNA